MEAVTFGYIILTTILLAILGGRMTDPWAMLLWRGEMLAAFAVCYGLYRWYPCRALYILRMLPTTFALINWYPETYEFCRLWNYQDHIFASIDHTLFGCQPSLEFCKLLDCTFWNEAFSLGYYSYYYMFAVMFFYYYIYRPKECNRMGFVFLTSFFIFYLIYFFLPVAGPQYYFKAVGEECALTGIFPDTGRYLAFHSDLIPLDVRGIFSRLVEMAQEAGEHPTAAFPSSHVGMSTVTMLLIMRARQWKIFSVFLPLYVLLCCATVYLRAHYVIDSICGFLSAVALYYLMNYIYTVFNIEKKLGL